jgi:DNA invertase Pin-like site-specific DNA recombinase
MSTEGQQYSIAYQQLAIRQYALARGMTIVRSYADEGISGLTAEGRPALLQLLSDVQGDRADFSIILVYDVSRWGRFQDTDESAHYEYLCRKANVRVEYCAEPFSNDSSPLTAIYKSIKRAMAAEYSREQSIRVHRAVAQAASRGYFTGGKPGLGFSRMLVAPDGRHKGILPVGVRRDIRSDHMTLVPGPAVELKIVRRIFHLFVNRHFSPQKIAIAVDREFGRRFHPGTIRSILRNERYIGTSTYNRQSKKLKGRRATNPRSAWIRVPKAYNPVVPKKLFAKAQAVMRERRHRQHTEESLLARLRMLLNKHGYLSAAIIRADSKPDVVQYKRKFGGVRQAYARLGYVQALDRFHNVPRALRTKEILSRLQDKLFAELRPRGHAIEKAWPARLIVVDQIMTVAMNAAPHIPVPKRKDRGAAKGQRWGWYLYISRKYAARFTIVVRLDKENRDAKDFFLVPGEYTSSRRLWLSNRNLDKIHALHFATFSSVLSEIERRIDESRAHCHPARTGAPHAAT